MEEGGIYILTTPSKDGKTEYRVTHAYDVRGITGKDSDGCGDSAVDKAIVRKLFLRCKVFTDKSEADIYADRMYYRYEMSDPFLVKAGVNTISLARNFSFYGGGKNEKKKTKENEKKSGKKSYNRAAKNK